MDARANVVLLASRRLAGRINDIAEDPLSDPLLQVICKSVSAANANGFH